MRQILEDGEQARILRCVGKVLLCSLLDEPWQEHVGESQRGGNHDPVTILRWVDLVGVGPVQTALPRRDRRLPCTIRKEPLHQDLLGAADQRFVRGKVHMLRFAGLRRGPVSGERADGGVQADRVVGLVAVAVQRATLGVSSYRGGARERVRDQVRDRPARSRPGEPHGRDRHASKSRVDLP